ncbi:hypothetical protein H2199_003600 [Coniosporium tulheliwenetii]|uniref:Uncharacterized protein n=1 Tax=Coniosporium tulheliwenetii TaxID=3383036 RepID=A0ACC2ZA64_9PEZI|nr:hypothetical protein H2199_003600 [Cladosporium sp. JES 115]
MRSSSFNQQRLISYIFMILSFLSLVAHAIPPEDVEYPELADIQAQLDILRAGLAAYRNADNSNVSSGDAGEYQYGLLPPINEVWHQYNVHAWLEETIRTNGCFSESFVQTDTPGAALSGVNGDEPQTCSIGSYLNLPGHNVPDDIMEELLIALLDAMATFDQVVAILRRLLMTAS